MTVPGKENLSFALSPERAPKGKNPTATPQRSVVAVLGMHRSSTSALAGLLCKAGGWVGSEQDLLPPNEGNSLGYFERAETAQTLDMLLEEMGGSWHEPPLSDLNSGSFDRVRPRLTNLISEVARAAPRSAVPLIKDPRLSLFAAELPNILGEEPRIAVCVRHPMEVARSLQKAHGLSIRSSLALWECYNTTICSGLKGLDVFVFSAARALKDKKIVANMVLGLLNFAGETRYAAQAVAAACEHLVPNLRHEQASASDDRAWLSVAQHELWQALDKLGSRPQPSRLPTFILSPGAAEDLRQHSEGVPRRADLKSSTQEVHPSASKRDRNVERRIL